MCVLVSFTALSTPAKTHLATSLGQCTPGVTSRTADPERHRPIGSSQEGAVNPTNYYYLFSPRTATPRSLVISRDLSRIRLPPREIPVGSPRARDVYRHLVSNILCTIVCNIFFSISIFYLFK